MRLKQSIHTWILLLATACSGADENLADKPSDSGTADNLLKVTVIKSGFTDEQGNTRAIFDDINFSNTFENGDQIGVIAVKDGAVVASCNNVPLTYTDGNWEGNVYYVKNAFYIAYSPYNASMDGKKSLEEVYDSFLPPTDQSTNKKLASAALMTSTTCIANKKDKKLSIVFEHRMAILCCNVEDTRKLYARTEISGYVYEIAKSSLMGNFKINGYTNFYSAHGFYFYMVKPSDPPTLTAEYSINSGVKVYNCSASVQSLMAGTYTEVKLTKKRNLQIGDYYYKNGSVWPNEIGTPPTANCVGIIYQTEANPERISPEEKAKGWRHALVISTNWEFLDQRYTWSAVEEQTTATGSYNIDNAIEDIYGYKQTVALFNLGHINYNYVRWQNRLIESDLQDRQSPWYVPGIGQWSDVIDNLTTVANSKDKRVEELGNKIIAGGGLFFNGATLGSNYYYVYASSQYDAAVANGLWIGYTHMGYFASYMLSALLNGGPEKMKAPNYPYNFGGSIWVYGCSF